VIRKYGSESRPAFRHGTHEVSSYFPNGSKGELQMKAKVFALAAPALPDIRANNR